MSNQVVIGQKRSGDDVGDSRIWLGEERFADRGTTTWNVVISNEESQFTKIVCRDEQHARELYGDLLLATEII